MQQQVLDRIPILMRCYYWAGFTAGESRYKTLAVLAQLLTLRIRVLPSAERLKGLKYWVQGTYFRSMG